MPKTVQTQEDVQAVRDAAVLATTGLDKVVAAVRAGEHTDLDEVLRAVAVVPDRLPVPANLPLPAVITEVQRKALKQLPKVFGAVVPIERRELTAPELLDLAKERIELTEIKKMIETRLSDGLRVTLFNHFDVVAEETGVATDETERDKDGYYILDGEAPVPELGQKFWRETRRGSVSLSAELLASLQDDPEFSDFFTHEDYLAMTTQTRVVDEHKVMLRLREKPELVKVIAAATTQGRGSAAFAPMRKL